jgi:sigma-B regulation protein RsbU (phosphoserine phosphatase)
MLSQSRDVALHILSSPILIVDDNEICRTFLDKSLRARGFNNLKLVASSEEALKEMPIFLPDIVLLDILMPDGMDGFECCKAIRRQERYRDLPVLVQTVITEPELRVKAFENGATDFVSKPVFPDELCARVLVHLEKQHALKVLQFYKSRIEVELEAARQLQLSILPTSEDIKEIGRRCHLDMAAQFEPSSEIGGDLWGLRPLFPHQTAFWLVDFAGHGMASALNAFQLHAYIKENAALAARPGEYMSYLNDKLLPLLQPGHFAAMFYGIVDTQSNQLFYSCACMPHPVLWHKETGIAEVVDGSGHPLGIGLDLYQTHTASFAQGDVLLFYSDALTETPNELGQYITDQQVIELLQRHANLSAEAIKELLVDMFRKHAKGDFRDDLTIVVCSRATT